MRQRATVSKISLLQVLCVCCFSAVVGVLLSACSESGTVQPGADDAAGNASSARVMIVDDPAMAVPAQTSMARAVRADSLPTDVTLNETQDQIFIPGRGWLPLTEFWEMYENQPELLPDNLNYQSVHRIRLSLAEQDNDKS